MKESVKCVECGIQKRGRLQMKGKKKILILIHDASMSGVPLLGLNIGKKYYLRGYEVLFLIYDKGKDFDCFKKYGKVFQLQGRCLYFFFPILRLYGVKRAICTTVCVCDACKPLQIAGIRNILLINEMSEAVKSYNKVEKFKKVSRIPLKVIFPNKFVLENNQQKFNLCKKNMMIRPQGMYRKLVHFSEEEKNLQKQRLNIPKQKKIILMIGSICARKGLDFFVKVAEIMRDEETIFVWVGNPVDETFEKKARRLYKEPNIRFISGTMEIDIFYQIADVFFLSSREDPFPFVVLDSLAYGVPVVAFENAGGFAELPSKYVNLIPLSDIEGMANRIREILDNGDYLNKVKRNAPRYIQRKFDFDNYVDDLEKILK